MSLKQGEINRARARNATHCPKGHALTVDNLHRYSGGGADNGQYAHKGKRYSIGCYTCHKIRRLKIRIVKGLVLPKDTPSVISGYKEPLTKVHNGYGFLGTIAFNKEQTHTQCHICGFFFRNLSLHTTTDHKIKVNDYKDKLGIGRTVSLMAPVTRKKYYDNWEKLPADEKLKRATEMKAGRLLAGKEGNRHKKSLHKKNLEGRCPEQLLDKIKRLADKLGQAPTRKEFDNEYKDEGYFIGSVALTFGTWTEALKILNLTPRLARGMRPIYDQATLIVAMQDFEKRYGREPYTKDIRAGLLPSFYTFRKNFGSFSKAKEFIK